MLKRVFVYRGRLWGNLSPVTGIWLQVMQHLEPAIQISPWCPSLPNRFNAWSFLTTQSRHSVRSSLCLPPHKATSQLMSQPPPELYEKPKGCPRNHEYGLWYYESAQITHVWFLTNSHNIFRALRTRCASWWTRQDVLMAPVQACQSTMSCPQPRPNCITQIPIPRF